MAGCDRLGIVRPVRPLSMAENKNIEARYLGRRQLFWCFRNGPHRPTYRAHAARLVGGMAWFAMAVGDVSK